MFTFIKKYIILYLGQVKGPITNERNKQMKLYMVVIYKNGKVITRATGTDLQSLRNWAMDCEAEDEGVSYEIYEEKK